MTFHYQKYKLRNYKKTLEALYLKVILYHNLHIFKLKIFIKKFTFDFMIKFISTKNCLFRIVNLQKLR